MKKKDVTSKDYLAKLLSHQFSSHKHRRVRQIIKNKIITLPSVLPSYPAREANTDASLVEKPVISVIRRLK